MKLDSEMFAPTQLQALSDLYYATNGTNWKYTSCNGGVQWNFTQINVNPCLEQWCGITCNNDQTSIQGLVLWSYFLTGTLPTTIDQLIDLEDLELASNQISGTIPSSIIKLTKLQILDLSSNLLQGTIPSIFSNESNLVKVRFFGNQLIGTVPVSFKQLKYIARIDFTSNDLWGKIDWLNADQLNQLIELSLSNNLFSGTFPAISNLTKMTSLALSVNSFEGSLPSDIFQTSVNLQTVFIHSNQFTGTLPTTLFSSHLTSIDIDNNHFTGRLGHNNWANIYQISMTNNYLSGSLPKSLCLSNTVLSLNIGFNYLSGPLTMSTCQSRLYLHTLDLTLQANFFTGALHEIFDSSQNHSINNLALSNNDLTGSIPAEFFFSAPQLMVYAVGTNCLSGTIPQEICSVTSLQGFSIDGASTSERCRRQIIDIPSLGLSAFTSKKQITGTIPSCLFELPYILGLYLSGNGLTGTLPAVSFSNRSYLWNISLSFNQLTGTIPLTWYHTEWFLLDLSYNKLTGTIPENSEVFHNQKSFKPIISLEVNRLSGNIPSVVTSFDGSTTILKGNMFTCSLNKQELPKNDPDSTIYVCGSNMVNNSLYLWILIGSILLLFTGFYQLRKSCCRRLTYLEKFKEKISEISKVLFIDNLPRHLLAGRISSMHYPSISAFFSFTLLIRQYVMFVLGFIFIVLMPICAVLGIYYRTYSQRYAWTISPIFLSGTNPTIILMIFFVLFIIFMVLLVHILFKKAAQEYYDRQKSCYRIGLKWRVLSLWTIAWLINGLIMITADSLYVYLIIHRSTKYEYVIQITLALFKLGWHDIGIFQMIHKLKKIFALTPDNNQPSSSISLEYTNLEAITLPMLSLPNTTEELEERIEREKAGESSIKSYFHSSLLSPQDIRYLTYMSIINKVIIPCLAIFFISSSCFYNALVSVNPPAAYYYIGYISFDNINVLGSNDNNSSFTPAFSYSYQCSSAFLTDYVPVFVFMLLVSSVVLPCFTLTIIMLYERRRRVNHSVNDLNLLFLRKFLPLGWEEEEDQMNLKIKSRHLILHRKQLLTLRISYTLAVMLVFGSLFPPLALIAAIAIINITMLEEYLTKRMLDRSDLNTSDPDLNHSNYVEYLEEECKHIDWNLFKVIKLIVCLTCGLLGFVLFDICGDRNGWSEGIIPFVLMIVIPFVLYSLISFRLQKRLTYTNREEECMY